MQLNLNAKKISQDPCNVTRPRIMLNIFLGVNGTNVRQIGVWFYIRGVSCALMILVVKDQKKQEQNNYRKQFVSMSQQKTHITFLQKGSSAVRVKTID